VPPSRYSKGQGKTGGEPRVRFRDLVKIMVDRDMELLGLNPPGEGKRILERCNIFWTQNSLTRG
jgi:GDPmannose 4,6-dehydratase